MLSKCITILVRWFIIVTNSSEAYAPVCNIKIKWIYESTFINHRGNVLDASICRRDFTLSLCLFLLLMALIWFSKKCFNVLMLLVLSLCLFLLLIALIWFSKKCFSVLMLLVLLTWICMPISFFSNLLHSALNFESLFIVHSIQKSGGKKEYAFPVNFQQ